MWDAQLNAKSQVVIAAGNGCSRGADVSLLIADCSSSTGVACMQGLYWMRQAI